MVPAGPSGPSRTEPSHPENRGYALDLVRALLELGNISAHQGDAKCRPRSVRGGAARLWKTAHERAPERPRHSRFSKPLRLRTKGRPRPIRGSSRMARPLLETGGSVVSQGGEPAAPAEELQCRDSSWRSEALWDLARVLRALKRPDDAENVTERERIALWKSRPERELIDLALEHLEQATLIGYGKTRLPARPRPFASSISSRPPVT